MFSVKDVDEIASLIKKAKEKAEKLIAEHSDFVDVVDALSDALRDLEDIREDLEFGLM